MDSRLLRPMRFIRRSLHIKLMLSAMLVIALIMAFGLHPIWVTPRNRPRRPVPACRRTSAVLLKLPDAHATTDLGRITPDAVDPNLDTLICRADGQLSWSSMHMPEVIQARDTICQDLMKYLGGLDQGLLLQAPHHQERRELLHLQPALLRNHGDGPTTYYVVMVDSAKRYLVQTRDYLYQCIRQALLAYSCSAPCCSPASGAWAPAHHGAPDGRDPGRQAGGALQRL